MSSCHLIYTIRHGEIVQYTVTHYRSHTHSVAIQPMKDEAPQLQKASHMCVSTISLVQCTILFCYTVVRFYVRAANTLVNCNTLPRYPGLQLGGVVTMNVGARNQVTAMCKEAITCFKRVLKVSTQTLVHQCSMRRTAPSLRVISHIRLCYLV